MKRTELKVVVAFGLYALLNKVGSSPDIAGADLSSFLSSLQGQLGDDPITTIVLGAVVAIYTWSRTKRKNIKDSIEARLTLAKNLKE